MQIATGISATVLSYVVGLFFTMAIELPIGTLVKMIEAMVTAKARSCAKSKDEEKEQRKHAF